jgi:hypothetical protein
MSSARNHAKRSHRSEHTKRMSIGTSIRKMYVREKDKPKRISFFEKFKNLFHRKSSNG